MTFRILTVCTGNICRSPMAEQLLREKLQHIPDLVVASAGTGALVGAGMPQQAAALASRHGARATDRHRARQLQPLMVREADLVLALARDHKRRILEEVPSALRRTFTVREFAAVSGAVKLVDLVAGDVHAVGDGLFAQPPGRQDAGLVMAAGGSKRDFDTELIEATLKGAVGAAHLLRAEVTSSMPRDDLDVVDPFRKSHDVYIESGRQLVPAVNALAEYLYEALASAEERQANLRRL